MRIKYDSEVDAMYIELRKGEFSKNKIIDDLTIIDLDKDGNMLGIELLDASKRFPGKDFKEVHVENLAVIQE